MAGEFLGRYVSIVRDVELCTYSRVCTQWSGKQGGSCCKVADNASTRSCHPLAAHAWNACYRWRPSEEVPALG